MYMLTFFYKNYWEPIGIFQCILQTLQIEPILQTIFKQQIIKKRK